MMRCTSRLNRFIPACAGNARSAPRLSGPCAVHPRVCGERIRPGSHCSFEFGSSPRVRGTLRQEVALEIIKRFIPACAGNAVIVPSYLKTLTVHPRVCGERLNVIFHECPAAGSSPRVRGTLLNSHAAEDIIRFIPACAGNAWSKPTPRGTVSVHPRVCGERAVGSCASSQLSGSSPRVRGTPRAVTARQFVKRFIPACAGNAVCLERCCVRCTVHPRVCGERSRLHSCRGVLLGSSPRVRGTLMKRRIMRPSFRFIPACAGNAHR